MLIFCMMLRFILLISLVCAHGVEMEEKIGCRFATCRDCVAGKLGDCVWRYYYGGAQKCSLKTGHVSSRVEAEADEPTECANPICVVPRHEAWDLEGIAQLVGGIFGGFLGGYLGILGFRKVRQGRGNRVGYQQIGNEESWRDALREFFGAFIDRLSRRNIVSVHVEDDPAAERQLRAALQRRIQERNQQQMQENVGGINQAGMGMQFGVQENVADEANGISPDRPGTSGGAAIEPTQNLTVGGNNRALDSDDDDDEE